MDQPKETMEKGDVLAKTMYYAHIYTFDVLTIFNTWASHWCCKVEPSFSSFFVTFTKLHEGESINDIQRLTTDTQMSKMGI